MYLHEISIYGCMGPLGKPEADDVNNFANRSLVPAKTSEMVIHYKDSKGVDRIKGGRDLKASQAYPKMCSGQISCWWETLFCPNGEANAGTISMWVLFRSTIMFEFGSETSHCRIKESRSQMESLSVEGFLIQSRTCVLSQKSRRLTAKPSAAYSAYIHICIFTCINIYMSIYI